MMRIFIIFAALMVSTMIGFVATAYATGNLWLSFIGAAVAQTVAASVVWKIEWGQWNPFS